MADTTAPRPFVVISGKAVHDAVHGREKELLDLVEHGYRLHGDGRTVNPPSYFLRFPEEPANRIIALPASVGGDVAVSGIKWISSFPANVDKGIPRASAVIVLNDQETGYPLACLEGSIISAVRTAASAAVAAVKLGAGRPKPARLGVVGTGLIARFVHAYLVAAGFAFEEIGLFDHSAEHARGFAGYLERADARRVTVHDDLEGLVRSADLLLFATTAGTPYVEDPNWFAHHPLVLHVSLRDLSPEVVLDSCNVVDDIEHCLKAATSVHLAEQATHNRDHVHATLYDVLTGTFTPPGDRTVVFSPFGLGVLDLVVSRHVYDRTTAGVVVDDFFHELSRYGG
ncbi:2,3-diaminopropionate biosynthesis protein SbnB [Streptomyces phyllanthi]|uniref:2,3-diaminopropionate biosynthesis protein SbnB n=1 Tax=Streptomyces phyllanthi TaxID=1803180 RepID=A0A5N8W221_9ACTN|nr:2,3-diaminopropionate biosynthesis protein SbnB [Streptomyces phyllanthi]MPY41550.1 2,3-diaminopropionate biosynthesis protein SbnB [Streptomyces phyllanthi]